MKRFSVLFVAILLMFCFAGCKGEKEVKKASESSVPEEVTSSATSQTDNGGEIFAAGEDTPAEKESGGEESSGNESTSPAEHEQNNEPEEEKPSEDAR